MASGWVVGTVDCVDLSRTHDSIQGPDSLSIYINDLGCRQNATNYQFGGERCAGPIGESGLALTGSRSQFETLVQADREISCYLFFRIAPLSRR